MLTTFAAFFASCWALTRLLECLLSLCVKPKTVRANDNIKRKLLETRDALLAKEEKEKGNLEHVAAIADGVYEFLCDLEEK